MATPWAKITFFPAVWATTWQAVAYLSPVGYLATWTPVAGIDAYDWLRPLAGTWGLNWVVGASAVVGAEMVGAWFIGPEDGEPLLIDDIPTDVAPRKAEETASRGSRHTLLLGAGLLALTAPSFLFPVHPIHPVESTFETSTPLIVGCILPPPPREGEHTTALERFIDESKKHNGAKVLLWPEGALRFENPTQRDEAFELVRKRVVGPLVGVTYEEPIPGNAHGKWRTGLTLVGPQGPVAEYFKRNLVPIAESFSLAPSLEPPSIYELKLSAPKGRRLEWAPNTPDNTRDIPLTSSICLDFATPSPFSALATRPALVLAPARTWHRDVGRAMWEQARARAEELGSAVLFCDGGAGGLSGVAGHGAREPMQEGAGSWTRAIGVEWPVVQRRTPYAWGGDGAVLVAVWAILGVGSVGEAVVGGLLGRRGREGEGLTVVRRVREAVSRLSGLVRSWRRPPQGEEQPLLF
ncbi:hypothetical protein BV25DRAFT_1796576 [Artomyces pyxidatus]|uniref:Uncharacterized protein n=1 Tax=Artomyces pyxidatus TaxID=48021 RepID=A0ACB8TDI3_9AGAM|nr:hypothetical protein BV25DRAFT_1796576 [Artomyces pyxidatus]